MKTVFGRFLGSLVLVAAALFSLACDKVKTPTEPATAQLASMSGKVTWLYGDGPIAGASVLCQGRSTITSSDGTYSFMGLVSGKTSVTVAGYYPHDESTFFSIELKPGPNTVDLSVL